MALKLVCADTGANCPFQVVAERSTRGFVERRVEDRDQLHRRVSGEGPRGPPRGEHRFDRLVIEVVEAEEARRRPQGEGRPAPWGECDTRGRDHRHPPLGSDPRGEGSQDAAPTDPVLALDQDRRGTGLGAELAYDEISQLGAEIETNAGMWRLWAEGFRRHGSRFSDGRRADHHHAAVAAEHQLFGAFGERFDMFTELRLAYDSRGVRADRPFQNAVSLSWTAIGIGERPFEAEVGLLYDYELEGAGAKLAVSKQFSSAPSSS